MIILIAAVAENNALGLNNQMIWHLPNDFKHFKTLTSGHHIIMGRKTFESLPKKLPNRKHIIITRQENYTQEDCFVANNINDALQFCKEEKEIYIIGGGEIYRQAIEIADKIELTRVHSKFEADTYFPEIDLSKWEITKEEKHLADEKHQYPYTFQTFIKK